MRGRRRAWVLTIAAAVAVSAPPSAQAAAGPPLTAPAERLAEALACPGPDATTLLVHGYASTPRETWPAGIGLPACTLALPARGTDDLQLQTEYVVAALRANAGLTRVVAHGEAGLIAQAALAYWPDVAARVDRLVILGAPRGDVLGCSLGACPPAARQVMADARYRRAAGRRTRPATTITPELVRERCPGHSVEHDDLTVDGPSTSLVQSALAGADPPAADCARPDTAPSRAFQAAGARNQARRGAPRTPVEPELRCYLEATCAEPDERGRVLRAVRLTGTGLLKLDVQAPGFVRVQLRGRTVFSVDFDRAPQKRTRRLEAFARPRTYDVTITARPAGYDAFAVEQRLSARVTRAPRRTASRP